MRRPALPGIVLGPWSALAEQASAIRFKVFVDEQRVPRDMELDEFDALSCHALARIGEQPWMLRRQFSPVGTTTC